MSPRKQRNVWNASCSRLSILVTSCPPGTSRSLEQTNRHVTCRVPSTEDRTVFISQQICSVSKKVEALVVHDAK